jgi:hypothetical protein
MYNNILNKGFIAYPRRYKYLPVNYSINQMGAIAAGRNKSAIEINPLNLKSGT